MSTEAKISAADSRWVFIRVFETTRVKLLKRGKKGDRYEDIITKLLDEAGA
jgi:hypothetical protein